MRTGCDSRSVSLIVCRVVALLGIGAGVLAAPALGQDCPEYLGQWPYGEDMYAVAVSGDYAYFGAGTALVVADISDPENPQQVGVVALPSVPHRNVVSGGYLYVADYFGGLRIIDVSQPTNPNEVGFLDDPGHIARGVAVSGGFAYVTDGDLGLRVIDVSNSTAPSVCGSAATTSWAEGVVVDGNYAYVAANNAGVRVYDISSPCSPVHVGTCDTPNGTWKIAVSGGYAYVAMMDNGLSVCDVSNAAAPVEVGYIDTQGVAGGVAVSGSFAYVGDGIAGLLVIDVSTPSAPHEEASLDTPGISWGVAVAGEYVYLGDDESSRPHRPRSAFFQPRRTRMASQSRAAMPTWRITQSPTASRREPPGRAWRLACVSSVFPNPRRRLNSVSSTPRGGRSMSRWRGATPTSRTTWRACA
jgi:hypothetical protein